MSKVNIEINEKNITVALPNAELLDIDISERQSLILCKPQFGLKAVFPVFSP